MNLEVFAQLIPLIPLLGFFFCMFLGKQTRELGTSVVASLAVLIAFAFSSLIFLELTTQNEIKPIRILVWDWLNIGKLSINYTIQLDQLSAIMMLIITGIGFLIHVYSYGYMKGDPGFSRFFAYLNLFVFFMLILVMGGNYLVMFIGWEGVGLCSYLLIGFWYKNPEYNKAANKAFIMNRIGDLGLLLGIFLLFMQFNTLEYHRINFQASSIDLNDPLIRNATLLLFIGAIGKSAQIPLFTWLPDAMAGPTPVSALIHAATMVTAGIYLIIRSHIIFSLAPFTGNIIMVIGLLTMVIAATIGLKQNDIKKVLAYSTVSQLGYMFFALGMGAYTAAFFHLLTHAFFKALLFLGSGSVIHAMGGEQDIRKMGALRKKMPITYVTFLIGCIAIAGIPPLSGFFSKDQILLAAFEKHPSLWVIGVCGAFLTAFYMFRLFFLTFHGDFRGSEEQKHHLHESPYSMTIPLMILAVGSAVAGLLNVPELLGGSSCLTEFFQPFLAGSVLIAEELHGVHQPISHTTEWLLMGISVVGVFGVISYTYLRYLKNKHVPVSDNQDLPLLENVFHRKYYVDEIYDKVVVHPFLQLSNGIYHYLERNVFDKTIHVTGRFIMFLSRVVRFVQSGNVGYYIFAMVIGVLLILLYNFLSY